MTYSIDANVLLYASDAANPRFARANDFLRGCSVNRELLCFTWPTLMAYLRISTHPSIFSNPLSPSEAYDNVRSLLSWPQARVLSEDDGFWDAFEEATADQVVRGNLVPDAHLAALLLQHGVRKLYTFDSDFRRFRFLDVRNPFA